MQSIVSEKIREGANITPDDDKFRYFNIAGYLLDYILSKDFPISMGIYGKWGTGKTVIANFMKKIAEEKNKDIDIDNQIHFFKFDVAAFKNSGKDIFWYLIASVSRDIGLKGIGRKIWRSIKPIMGGALKMLLKKHVGDDGLEIVSNYLGNEELRKTLIKGIQKKYQKGKNIMIIDNLDRLQPIETVSFLESLKSFLLVDGNDFLKNFAYIILCDFEIISKEIQNIYHDNIDVRDYLNKIIEVPFYIPSYNPSLTRGFIKSLLSSELIEETKNTICDMLENANVQTPRDIKNFLLELDMIFIIAKARGQVEKKLIDDLPKLFAAQVLKAKYFYIFNYIDKNSDRLKKEGNMEGFTNLLYDYVNTVSHGRDWEHIRLSHDPQDVKLMNDMRIAHYILNKSGLIHKPGNEYRISDDVNAIFRIVDGVTLNYSVEVKDKLGLNDQAGITKS